MWPADSGAGAVLNQEGVVADTTIGSITEPVAYEPGFEVREEAGKRPYAILGVFALTLSMIGDVKCEEAHVGLFSVKLPVIAVLHGDLFVGEATAYLNRKGTIDLRSVLDANGKCFGSFRFTEAKAGVADMQCNDGSAARLAFSALSTFSGYGSGSTPNGPASFTFGLRPEVAALHLILPAGKKLVEGSEGLRLESAKL